jgi:pSer/pThr/pTyr-binding forkhead associated (FHA) protein
MILCRRCGTATKPGHVHCPICGEALHSSEVVHHPSEVVIRNAPHTEERALPQEPDTAPEIPALPQTGELDTSPPVIISLPPEPDTSPPTLVAGPPASGTPVVVSRPLEPDTSPPTLVVPSRGAVGEQATVPRGRGPAPQVPREVHLVVVLGRIVVAEFRFHSGVISIGRDNRQDVVLDNPTVSRLHCKIRCEGERAVLEDQGTPNGTSLNGHEVQRAELAPGDEIGIGKYLVLFRPTSAQLAHLEAPRSASPADGALDPSGTHFLSLSDIRHIKRDQAEEHGAHIKVVGSDGRLGRRIPLFKGTTVLGRSIDADIPLRGWLIKDHHALIVRTSGRYRLIHTAGLRPVLVNGIPIRERTLQNHDEIRIGSNRFSFFAAV